MNLGKVTDDFLDEGVLQHSNIRTTGPFAGAALKYHFLDAWYVSARGGFFQSSVKIRTRSDNPAVIESGRSSTSASSWYAGAGLGYDVTPSLSLGVNYDNYRSKATEDVTVKFNVAMFSVSAEYRF